MIVAFVLFQKRDDARQFMKFLHPDLGVGNTHFQNGSFVFKFLYYMCNAFDAAELLILVFLGSFIASISFIIVFCLT